MSLLSLLVLITAGVTGVAAFPELAKMAPGGDYAALKAAYIKRQSTSPGSTIANVTGLSVVPDAAHKYIAPGPTDQRGPCPGLNAAANYGYLPHNGIANYTEFINGVYDAYAMGNDLSGFVFFQSLYYVGDPDTGFLSIGGPDNRTARAGKTVNQTRNLIGYAGGLDYHTRGIEGDASASREDFYFGDDHDMQPTLVQQMINIAANYDGLWGLDTMMDIQLARYQNSIATNPTFYYVPVPAGIGMGARAIYSVFFSNGTYLDGGVPNQESMLAFLGYEPRANGAYVKVPERFPVNWYRRGTAVNMTDFAYAMLDFQTSRNLTYGANAGTVNSFVPLNLPQATSIPEIACQLRDAVQANIPAKLPTNTMSDKDRKALVAELAAAVAPQFVPFNCSAYNPVPNVAAFRNISQWQSPPNE